MISESNQVLLLVVETTDRISGYQYESMTFNDMFQESRYVFNYPVLQ